MVQSPGERLKEYWPRKQSSTIPVEAESGPRASAHEWLEWLARNMSERPGITLGAAALIGVAVGWMVKRK